MAVKIRLESIDRLELDATIRDLRALSKGRLVFGKPRKGKNHASEVWRVYGELISNTPRQLPPIDDDDVPF